MAMQGPSGDVAAEVEQPKDAIEVLFTYHTPTPEQTEAYKRIRTAAMALAREIDRSCHKDQTRQLRRRLAEKRRRQTALPLALLLLAATLAGCGAKRVPSSAEVEMSFPVPAHYSTWDRWRALGPVRVGDSLMVRDAGVRVLAVTDDAVTFRVTVRRKR